ncbi:MAG TPA: hypothetical protein VLA98_09715, partial [Solirubrobacteraceae bacterium]|nr:hypothetical protein [Solirubrobacteraceae bacterium]
MPASAAVAGQYTLGGDAAHGGNRLTYSDKAAETNNVTFSLAGGEVVLHDAGAPVVQATDPATGLPRGLSCRIIDAQTVGCPLANAGQAIRFLAVNADVGDDVVTNATDIPSILNGEQGNDTLTGGSAADTLNGDGGIDTLDGGAGDDVIETDGHDAATGYGGERDIVTCGPGNDTAKIDRKDTVDDVQPPFTANFTPGSPTTCESVVFEGTPVGTTPPPGPPPPPA